MFPFSAVFKLEKLFSYPELLPYFESIQPILAK